MKITALIILILSLLSPLVLHADPASKQAVISYVKAKHSGRVLSATAKEGSSVYKVKLLQADGRVKVIRVDAQQVGQ